jgi:sec-independent protein translocase protein TatA
MERLGPVEIGLILIIVLIVFGVGKLPQVGGALGKGLHDFRQAVKGEDVSPKATAAKSAQSTSEGTPAKSEGSKITPLDW